MLETKIVAEVLGVKPADVRRAAKALGNVGRMLRGGRAHYSSDDIDRIKEYLKK